MPNWCGCTLVVKGETDEVSKFVTPVIGNKFEILGTHHPVPDILDGIYSGCHVMDDGTVLHNWVVVDGKHIPVDEQSLINACGHTSSYDWCVENWGSKWGDCRSELIEHNEEMVILSFEAAWCPPIEGIRYLSEKFPELIFLLEYREYGEGYVGTAMFKAGNINPR